MNHKRLRKIFSFLLGFSSVHILLLLQQFHISQCFYVGPEVGNAPGERSTRGGIRNATSLAEAAYVPYVYAVGNNVVDFLRSIVPALQPNVDFFAEQIQDAIDTANVKIMQTLEHSNNGIIAMENFFNGLMRSFVFGKGPDDEDRRRVAMALLKSERMTTTKPTIATTTTGQPVKRSSKTLANSTHHSSANATTISTNFPRHEIPQVS